MRSYPAPQPVNPAVPSRSDCRPVSLKDQLARFLSFCGHPFLFPPVVALIVGSLILGPAQSIKAVATVVLFCLLPASILIVRQVRKGEWSDLDVSQRKDRPHLFFLALGFLALTVCILMVTGQSMAYAKGCIAAITLVCMGWLLNRWLKPSMHSGFAMLTAAALLPFGLKWAVPAILFAGAVGWSRIQLGRHMTKEVLLGLGLGFVVGRLIV